MPARTLAFVIALVGMLAAAVAPAAAGEWKPFDKAAFAAAQDAGKSVIVAVTAPWCPTCKAQRPIIDELIDGPDFKDVTIYEIDFDTGKDLMRPFNARSQSTIIAFKGKAETGRSVGDTNPASIDALLKSAL